VVLVQAAMNLDLRHKLLFGAGLCEWSLSNHLGCWNSLGLKVCELIALCETTFSKEFASKILLDADISIELDYLFFNNDLRIILLVLWRLCRLLLLLHVFLVCFCKVFATIGWFFLIIRKQIIFKSN
jgi:hypothetical protein